MNPPDADNPDVNDLTDAARRAAAAVRSAEALVIAAGAGMGVDSGLPDFRGPEGFWRAYPPYRRLGLGFADLANPAAFASDPAVGWGFYGHRLNLYRATVPHAGFAVLRRWADARPAGGRVFTSNVDGQFQAAGFDPGHVVECHGSIRHLQCAEPCGEHVWPADGVAVDVDASTMRAAGDLPTCPRCGGLARPNILMFGDGAWVEARTANQFARYRQWTAGLDPAALVVVELGAGTAVPTVRMHAERLQREGATIVRVNPREPHGPAGTVSVAAGALDGLRAIDALVRENAE
jgi:NAD-dependent SIR2 family protein deacetylase